MRLVPWASHGPWRRIGLCAWQAALGAAAPGGMQHSAAQDTAAATLARERAYTGSLKRHTINPRLGITLSEFYPVPLPQLAHPRTLETADGPLAALEAAPAGRIPTRCPAVLVPGFTGSKEDFIPLLSPIVAAGYRVISYDQRGQYESPGPSRADAYSTALFARDLHEVIGIISDGRPVHLVGHSFGGLVARDLAITEPALVRSLTLLDSGPAGARLLRARWLGLLVGFIRLGGLQVLARLMVWAPRKADIPADRLRWLRYRFLRSRRTGMVGMCLALLREPDRVDELSATAVPVLVICGENDDVWSPYVQEDMANRLNAPTVVIKNAGHTPNEEQPEATADAILKFWDAVEARNRGTMV